MKIFFLAFLLLFCANTYSQTMEKIKITGTAENSKAGAIIVTEKNEVYYLENINFWDNTVLRKTVEAEGTLNVEFFPADDLQNEKGEYKQGFSGNILTICNPVWKVVIGK